MSRVLVVSKTHLDVGFTDLAAGVRRRYLEDFFPRAMSVAAELRARGGPERLRWTIGSWILTEAVDAADAAGRRQLEAAIEAGDLNWHALPFTLHTEFCERSLLEHGMTLSAELDRRYGRRTRAAKATDVPGHTRGLVSVLADAGVDLLHVGVNPAASAPEVPLQFRWRDDAASAGAGSPEVAVMYQPGGYGDVQVVPGTGVAVALALTGDNLGPPSLADVLETFAALQARFPGAEVAAASLDEVAAVVAGARDLLPVVTAEIGDTWIHGVGSDPVKTAGFRALCRERARWFAEGSAVPSEPAVWHASNRLLLVAEHTWGLDEKTHWPDEDHWSAEDLDGVRSQPGTRRFESSWQEQRDYLDEYVELLRRGRREDLADRAAATLRGATRVAPVEVGSYQQVDPAAGPIVLGTFEVGVDPVDGAITHLCDATGRHWASEDSPLGRWSLQTFHDADFQRWFDTYNSETLPEDEWWARWDNTKPGLERSGAASARWSPVLRQARVGEEDEQAVLWLRLGFDTSAEDPVAVPDDAHLLVRAVSEEALGFELRCSGLPAARWPVAWWWTFTPQVGDPARWRMEKLGERVAPGDVVAGGGAGLHCADRLVHPDGIRVDLIDSPLVAPGRPRLLEWDGAPAAPGSALDGGWHLCLYANLWGTNFPMWIEGDLRFRTELTAR